MTTDGGLKAGGALGPDHYYVRRSADDDIVRCLLRGEFCYVLGPRQIGKSSLRLRARQELEQQGVRCASIDLSRFGTAGLSEAQWYGSLIEELAKALSLEPPDQPARDPVYGFRCYLNDVILPRIQAPVAIFIDEIERVQSLPFKTADFFAVIRSFYNQRAEQPDARRISFCLLGVATPDELVQDPAATPFNIGKRILLEDFSLDEAQVLLPGLEGLGEPHRWLEEVLQWTEGHPYMTQRLCIALRQRPRQQDREIREVVHEVVEQTFFQRPIAHENSLSGPEQYFRDRRAGDQQFQLLELYRKLLMGVRVQARVADRVQLKLLISGMAAERTDGAERILAVRNRVFARAFDEDWAKQQLSSRYLSVRLEHWLSSQRDPHYLLRGTPLREAESWARDRHDLTEEENSFLRDSLAAERQAERKRRIIATSITGLSLLVLCLLGWLGYEAWRRGQLEATLGDCTLGDERSCRNAFSYAKARCQQGSETACNRLGGMYEKGLGAPRDIKTAEGLYARTCERGNGVGCNSLGYLYEKGVGGTRKDAGKAVELYTKACSLGYKLGCNNLGYLYEQGLGVARNEQKSYQLYEHACRSGFARGCNNQGYLHEKGLGTVRDLGKARALYKNACDESIGLGCVNLGYQYEQDKDFAQAFLFYEKACGLDEPKGCTHLGYLCFTGQGCPLDKTRAAELYRRACDHPSEPDPRACNNLGVIQEDNGDLILAFGLYQRSCRAGYQLGCKNKRELEKHPDLFKPGR